MQMKEILHPGVVKTPVMCVVSGGVSKKRDTTLFIALRKCHYSGIRRRGGPRVVELSLAWIAD